MNKTGKTPEKYILSDNGREFDAAGYIDLIKKNNIGTCNIPPGSPWNNGALESGNKDFKKIISDILLGFW